MAKNTSNYNLKKPSPEDFYNVEDQNGNMDIIDQELERLNEDNQNTDQKISSVSSDLSSHLSDYVRQPGYGVTAGSANTYLLTLNPTPVLVDGTGVIIKIHAANTGASTLNVNGLGAKPIIDSKGNQIQSGKLLYGRIYSLKYDGANFQLQGEGGDIPKLPNLIKNGNFEKGGGVNCWAFAGSTISASSNIMTYTAIGQYGRVYQNVPKPAINDRIYIRCDLKGATTARFIFYYDANSLLGFDISPSVANTWQTLSSIFVCPSNTSFGNISFDDTATSGWQPIQVKNVTLFNLTKIFGPGNEPTKEEIDAMVFSSTNIVRNGNCEEGIAGWTRITGSDPILSVVGNKFRMVTTTLSIIGQTVTVKPNTNYYISGNMAVVSGANGAYIRPYTLDGNALINTTGVFNTGPNNIIRIGMLIGGAGTADFDSIMLVEGTTAPSSYKSYMPYGWWDSDLPLLINDADAVSGDILLNKVAYANGLRLAGTMPDRNSANTEALSTSIDPPASGNTGKLYMKPRTGYYDENGNNSWIYKVDPNFIPSNVVSGKSIFGLAGSAVTLGKKWASGTAYTSGSVPSIIFKTISNEDIWMYPVVVSGLTFKPSKIILRAKSGSTVYESIYQESSQEIDYARVVRTYEYRGGSTTILVYSFKADVAPASVTSTGFTLPVWLQGLSLVWEAYE